MATNLRISSTSDTPNKQYRKRIQATPRTSIAKTDQETLSTWGSAVTFVFMSRRVLITTTEISIALAGAAQVYNGRTLFTTIEMIMPSHFAARFKRPITGWIYAAAKVVFLILCQDGCEHIYSYS